ncbi:hypothetical protein GMST_10770 [Geomonas silvestris]|uniref:Uncharacterized protein n=1 Tax=Geomonas silvestris TaxID=2740184 RepID=A0A6V8MFM9_9BACT|nr:hypothetical protein [Geomonas silvestris]GFO58752.1 hypothetical protein GMST_10770 [Geomonas silvestris]
MVVYIKKGDKTHYLSGDLVPQVGVLFVDMLTMTLDIPEKDHGTVIAKFQKAKENGDGKWIKKTAYQFCLKLSGVDEADILVECCPTTSKNDKNSYRFIRIEFNPAKVNLPNLRKNIDFIIPGGYALLMKQGIVTRIDLTVDASYLDATDVVAMNPKVKVERHYAKNGTIETKYLGASSSNKQTVLYDKVAHLKHLNAKKEKALKTPLPPHNIFRIEQRLLKLNCTLNAVASLPNPFTDLTLIAYPGAKLTDAYSPLWTLFLSACRFEGVNAALQHLSPEHQEEFKRRLHKEGRSDWWKPGKVWEGVSAAIKVILTVKSNSPSSLKP